MNDARDLANELNKLSTFQQITNAYTEIAAVRMRKTRNSVVLNRTFVTELDDVFSDVRTSYAHEVIRLGSKKSDKGGVTFLSHNGKTVAVFISANTGLYGDIIEKTFNVFMKDVLQNPAEVEVAIVGKLGLGMFQSRAPDMQFSFFDLPDTNVTQNDIAQLIGHVVQYEEIWMYYPTFISAVRQDPTRYIISAQTPLSELQDSGKKRARYIFEPSLKEILAFFEKEIFASLVDQSVREAELAKHASRIMSLDRAGENMKKKLKELRLEKLRLEHTAKNKKQLETVRSMRAINR